MWIIKITFLILQMTKADSASEKMNWEFLAAEGRYEEAYNLALTQKETTAFQLGALAFQSQHWPEAIEKLSRSIKENKEMADYALMYRGRALMAQKHFQKAIDDFKKVEAVNRKGYMHDLSLFYQAEAFLEIKQWKKAEAFYKKIKKNLSHTELAPALAWGEMLSYFNLGAKSQFCRKAKEIFIKYPAYSKIENWGLQLQLNTIQGKKTGCPARFAEQKLRIQRLIWSGLSDKALAEISALEKKTNKEAQFDIVELSINYLLQEGYVDQARAILAKFNQDKKNDYDYLMDLGKVEARSENPSKGIEAYYHAYQIAKNQKQAAPALFQSAFLSYYTQDYEGAQNKFQEYLNHFPHTPSAPDVMWYSAWTMYLQKKYPEAERSIENLMALKRQKPRAWKEHQEEKLQYWLAMSQYRQGKNDQALETFNQLTHDDSLGYYAVAAFHRTRQIQKRGLASVTTDKKNEPHLNWLIPQAAASSSGAKKESEESSVAEDSFEKKVDDLLDAESGPEQNFVMDTTVEATPNVLSDDLRPVFFKNVEKSIDRAHQLMRLGEDGLAYREILEAESKKMNQQQKLWLLQAHQSVHSFHRSVALASNYFEDEGRKQGVANGSNYWNNIYPRAFDTVVEFYSKKTKVPQELLWSIMRAETLFRADAISPVGARGLMQLMPKTARKLASLKSEDVQVENLSRPFISIKWGSYYLQRLMKKLKNNLVLVAAAYNGGPHRVHAWLNYFGRLDLDEFIEHIPYQETRNYAKKVAKYYSAYELIYKKNPNSMKSLSEPVGVKLEGSVPTMETWEKY